MRTMPRVAVDSMTITEFCRRMNAIRRKHRRSWIVVQVDGREVSKVEQGRIVGGVFVRAAGARVEVIRITGRE